MDKLTHYRTAIQSILMEYHQMNLQSGSAIESSVVMDEVNDHYLLVLMGWQKDERIKSVMIHLRLKDGKIWIEEDWTEAGVATDLLQRGITPDEIVLAFHPPHLRCHTEFAVA